MSHALSLLTSFLLNVSKEHLLTPEHFAAPGQNQCLSLSQNPVIPQFVKADPPSYKVSVASRSKVEVLFQADIKFNLGNKKFTERFLILPDMNDMLLGLPFLDKKNVVVDCKRRLLKFSDFTFCIHSLQNDTSD